MQQLWPQLAPWMGKVSSSFWEGRAAADEVMGTKVMVTEPALGMK